MTDDNQIPAEQVAPAMAEQAAPAAAAEQAAAATQPGARRKRALQGRVRSDKMDKTVVVEVITRHKHRAYKKYVLRRRTYMAHDERNDCRKGDVVRIVECRPLSRNKRWRVQKLVERPA